MADSSQLNCATIFKTPAFKWFRMYDFDSDVTELQLRFCLQNVSKPDKCLKFANLRSKAISSICNMLLSSVWNI